jgi:hypothetical protein
MPASVKKGPPAMFRRTLGFLGLAVLACAVTVRAERPAACKGDNPDKKSDAVKDETALRQQILAKRFADFKSTLLRVQQRLAKGHEDDRKVARTLRKALDRIDTANLHTRFDQLVEILKHKPLKNPNNVEEALDQSRQMAEELRALLAILRDGDRLDRIRARGRQLSALLSELDKIIRDQAIVRAKTAKGDPKDDLIEGQKNVSSRTEKFADKLPADDPPSPKDPIAKAQKLIRAANKEQHAAEKNLDGDRNKKALQDQDTALDLLRRAKKLLEDVRNQGRTEEDEELLNALEKRCRLMLEMQRQVKAGTVKVDKDIRANDGKAKRALHQEASRLGDKENEIIREATKALELLGEEGKSIAFAEVLKQVRSDMEEVKDFLFRTKVGSLTQEIEEDIIQTLEEMIKALQKARRPGRPGPTGHGPHPPPPLVDQIAELKLLRSMQVKVNNRTKLYGKEYVAKEGEQTADATLKAKLKELSQRQEQLVDATLKIVKKANK